MNNTDIRAQGINFPFISSSNTFIRDICGYSLRTCTILMCILMVTLELVYYSGIVVICQGDDYNPLMNVFLTQYIAAFIWIPMLIAPIKDDPYWCYISSWVLVVYTPINLFSKAYELYYLHSGGFLPEERAIWNYIFISLCVFYVLWFVCLYIYFSYAKFISLKLQAEVSSNSAYASANSSNVQMMSCGLNVEQAPIIVLTNPNDIVFSRQNQNAVVNNTMFPSGLVIPSGGVEKNWRIVGDNIILI
jgi:hypothetical protein